MDDNLTLDEQILIELKSIKDGWEKEVIRLMEKLNAAKEQIVKNERLIKVFEEKLKDEQSN